MLKSKMVAVLKEETVRLRMWTTGVKTKQRNQIDTHQWDWPCVNPTVVSGETNVRHFGWYAEKGLILVPNMRKSRGA